MEYRVKVFDGKWHISKKMDRAQAEYLAEHFFFEGNSVSKAIVESIDGVVICEYEI